MSKYRDLSGKFFGRLEVIKRIDNKIVSGRSVVYYSCLCACGNFCEISRDSLVGGSTKSCGCLVKEIRHEKNNKYIKHGKTKTRLFSIWSGMKERCYREKHMWYSRYGGVGITVCEEWIEKENGFINFHEWAMSNGYNEELTIDRIDGNKGYFPENCRWVSRKSQQNNLKNNIKIEYNGEIKTIIDWCNEFSFPVNLARARYKRGLCFEEIFSPKKVKISEKQSGIKGIIWNKKQKIWIVKSIKNGKKDKYIGQFKELDDAINFKNEYELK